MTAFTLDTLTRQTSSSLITAYQRWISPHKGFICAHRVLHQGESCSQYAKRMILEQGLWHALLLMQERFEDCRVANEILQARRARQTRLQHRRSLHIEQPDLPPDAAPLPDLETPALGLTASEAVNPKRKPCSENSCNSGECRNTNCSDALDCADAFSDVADCSTDCATLDWNGCDSSNWNCGSMDCGSMDCGSLDCGSCG